MDISKLLQEGRVYLRKKFDEVHVYDASSNEEILVYAIRNGTYVTFDRVQDPTTGQITWKDPTGTSVPALVETSHIAYSEATVAQILDRLVEGESLTKICKSADMPKYSQLVRWMKYHPWIRQALEDARLARAEHHRDKVLEEADRAESSRDPIEASKVKIQAHQWLAGVDDSRYSAKNKIDVGISVPTTVIVNTGISRASPLEERTVQDTSSGDTEEKKCLEQK